MIRETAARVLIDNWRHDHTVPAAGLYPHQWSWDSAFIAIGLRHISPRRAQRELESLFSAQWEDGRLPQIVFDTSRDDDYSPGHSFWRSDLIPGSPPLSTAGLIQPPNHALATLMVHEADPAESRRRGFLERAYPALVSWHNYLEARRRTSSGLIAVVHPWESGMDNSPYWDAPLARVPDYSAETIPRPDLRHVAVQDRPSNTEYRKYLYLAARYRDHACDDSDADYPFLMEDPTVNALWARSELALSEIARELGVDPEAHLARADDITASLETLWDDGLNTYTARDAITGDLQPHRTIAGLIPLLLPGLNHADQLLAELRGPRFRLGHVALIPSNDLTAPSFDAGRYWRGPSWFNTAWLIAEALSSRGLTGEAERIGAEMIALAEANDFPEYVDPHSGDAKGTRQFSWTAALSLDLAIRAQGSQQ